MLKLKDIIVSKRRKKLWDTFGWVGKGKKFFSKNHSLNCGCSLCRSKTFFRRYKNKQDRLQHKKDLKNYIDE